MSGLFDIRTFTHNISFSLPDRKHAKYKDIEDFKEYEISNCVAYELATRNKDVQKELASYISYYQAAHKAIPKVRNGELHIDDLPKFDYTNFFNYGFSDLAIRYFMFRTEASKIDFLKDYSHEDLYIICSTAINNDGKMTEYLENGDSTGEKIYDFEPKELLSLLDKTFAYTSFTQGISSPCFKKDNKLYHIGFFDGAYYDETAENPYFLTKENKNNYLFHQGLYYYEKDPLDRHPIPKGELLDQEFIPTISLIYSRPYMIDPYRNKLIYAKINLNLSDKEIHANIDRILNIQREEKFIQHQIKEAYELFFEEEIHSKEPSNIAKRNLQHFYANLLYVYDTLQAFEAYKLRLKEKYEEGLKYIKSEKNTFVSNGNDRDEQRKTLKEWYTKEKSKDNLYREIYSAINPDIIDMPYKNNKINALVTLSKKLINNREYKFLI